MPSDHIYAAEGNAAEKPIATTISTSYQTDLSGEDIGAMLKKVSSLDDTKKMMRQEFVSQVTSTDKSVKYFTGIPTIVFLHGLFNILLKVFVSNL